MLAPTQRRSTIVYYKPFPKPGRGEVLFFSIGGLLVLVAPWVLEWLSGGPIVEPIYSKGIFVAYGLLILFFPLSLVALHKLEPWRRRRFERIAKERGHTLVPVDAERDEGAGHE